MPAGFVGAVLAMSVVAIDLVGAPTAAQTDPVAGPVEAISVTSTGGGPVAPVAIAPRVSDDGDVVVFDTLPADTASDAAIPGPPDRGDDGARAVVRVRSADTTTPVPDANGSRPAVSGDGCTVTWSRVVPGGSGGSSVELRLLDRCGAAPVAPVTALTTPGAAPLPPAALSYDAGVVVVSTGSELVRLVRGAGGVHAEAGRIAPGLDGPAVVGDDVDVSDDGSIVVFEAGPGTTPFEPEAPSVVRVRGDARQVVAAGAHDPTISGDGTLVAFEALGGGSGGAPGVVLARWPVDASGAPSLVSVAPGGTLPSLDPSGRHLALRAPDGMRLASGVGDPGAPFSTIVTTDLSEPVVGADAVASVTGAVVARGGRTVVFDSDDGTALTADPRFADAIGVWARTVPVTGGGEPVDLGSGDVGDRLVGTATIANDGPASLVVAADGVTVDAPFVVDATTCSAVIAPGATCTVTVAITIDRPDEVLGEVRVTGVGPVPATLTAAVSATGPATEGSTTSSTNATTPRYLPRPVPRPRSPYRPTSRSTPSTSAVVPLAFSPASFEFAPTIVLDGRRRASIELRNEAGTSTVVADVTLVDDPTGAFEVVATTCGGSLAPGAGCTIDVDFAPTVEGPAAATLLATETGGESTSIALSGVGAPPPTITVIPGVAGPGQVVTVRGAGFPSGAVVELVWGDGLVVVEVVVDESGTFDEPLVVLPNTPAGRVPIVVVGQADLFGDVDADMIVSLTGARSNPALGGGFGPHVGR